MRSKTYFNKRYLEILLTIKIDMMQFLKFFKALDIEGKKSIKEKKWN